MSTSAWQWIPPANIDAALGDSTIDNEGIDFLVLIGNVADLSTTLANIDTEIAGANNRVISAHIVDGYTAIDGADFDAGYMPLFTRVIVIDNAANLAPLFSNLGFPNNPGVTPTLLSMPISSLKSYCRRVPPSDFRWTTLASKPSWSVSTSFFCLIP